MWADFEPLTSVLRVFADGARWGDPYVWSASIRYLDKETIEFLGILRAPKPSEWRVIIEECVKLDIKKVVFYRMKNGNKVKKELLVRSRKKL